MNNVDPFRYQQQQDKQNRAAVNVAALVKVTAFDPSLMTVDVQPISKHLQDGTYQSQPPILGVPISFTKSGGFVIRPWINEGDVGLVVYVDHDIDNAVAEGKETTPNTERNHSTSDAVFIGGIVTGNAPVSGTPDEAAVIATEDGTVFFAVTKDGIKIKADVEIEGNMDVSGVTSVGIFSSTGTAGSDETVTVRGNINVIGRIDVTEDVTASEVSLNSHVHEGVTGGPDSTGKPLPM